MNWLLGGSVIFVLLIAACAMMANSASKDIDTAVDNSIRVLCYDDGYYDGTAGDIESPPFDSTACLNFYTNGYNDAEDNIYDPPARE